MALLVAGCDIVEEPYLTNPGDNNGGGETVRKVLLEEFTGHQCPNCPAGALEAKALKDFYGDRLVIVSIHAGFFALTGGSPFTYNFSTPAGEALFTHFGITSNPVGLVNRAPVDGGLILSPAAWGGAISQIMELDPLADIKLTLDYQASGRRLDITATSTILESMEGEYFLVLSLLEDGIVKPQQTNDSSLPSGVDMNYVHDHVLRAAINNTWGEKVFTGPVSTGNQHSGTWSVTLNQDWDAANCSVVAYLYRADDLVVIQAEEKAIVR